MLAKARMSARARMPARAGMPASAGKEAIASTPETIPASARMHITGGTPARAETLA